MEKKTTYKCGICGKEYETIAERAKCEMACVDKQLAIEEKAKKEKKKQEQEVRRQEVAAAINHASEILDAYLNDYGSFSYSPVEGIEPEKKEEPKAKIETVSKSEKTSSEPWPFDNWPFTSKLFNFFW